MTRRRRLAVVSQEYPPDKSGLASRMRDTATNLAAEDWDVHVVAPPPSFPRGKFDRKWYRSREHTQEGVRVTRLWAWQPISEDPGLLSRLAYYLTFALHATLWLAVRATRFDVVLTTTPPITTGLAGLVPKLAGAVWVVDVRDLWIDASISLGFLERGGRVARASRAYQRAILRLADSVSVTTETQGERLCEAYGESLRGKTVVVPNGVDTTQFGRDAGDDGSPRWDDDCPTIVYVGNIGHAQALDVCIEAMARIEHDAVFRLIGGGDIEPELKELAASEGVEDRVEFVDPVPRSEIPAILAEADVGVAPLVGDDELAYAMPTKVYEYLGSGLPVVATGQGELERFVEASESGRCVEIDADAVAAALDDLLASPDRREELGANGQAYVETRYDRRAIASRFDDHLRGLVDPTASASPEDLATPERIDDD